MDKKPDRPPLRIVVKYFLLQLPGQVSFVLLLILFRHWVDIPATLMAVLLGIWIGKDVILFPFLWRFYDPSRQSDRFQMVGRTGFALTRLNPGGHVLVQGERWQADIGEDMAPVERGEAVRVEGIDGLRLSVSACAEDSPGGKSTRSFGGSGRNLGSR